MAKKDKINEKNLKDLENKLLKLQKSVNGYKSQVKSLEKERDEYRIKAVSYDNLKEEKDQYLRSWGEVVEDNEKLRKELKGYKEMDTAGHAEIVVENVSENLKKEGGDLLKKGKNFLDEFFKK